MLSARGSRPYWGVLLPLPAAPPPPSSTAFYMSAVLFKSDLYNTDCLCTLICTILSAYFYCILPAGCLLLLSCAMLTVFFFCILHSTILVTFLYCISLTDRPLLCYCACCAFLFSYYAFSEALSAFYDSSSIAKQLSILRYDVSFAPILRYFNLETQSHSTAKNKARKKRTYHFILFARHCKIHW